MSPFEIRRINKVRETDRIESIWKDPSDVEFGSYGIDQCLDLVETALKSGRGLPKPEGDDWLEGTGVALAMLEFRSADRASLRRRDTPLPDGSYHLAVGSTEMGNGSTTSHRQIAASVLGTRASNIAIINGDTDQTPYDTGTFASTGTVVAGQAVEKTALALRDVLIDFAARHFGCEPADCRLQDDCDHLRQPQDAARRAPCGGRQGRRPLRREAQGVSVAAHDRLQRAWRARRRASRHRRDHDLAERARRRYRQADQSHAVPRPARRRHRHGLRLGALREDGLRRATARW